MGLNNSIINPKYMMKKIKFNRKYKIRILRTLLISYGNWENSTLIDLKTCFNICRQLIMTLISRNDLIMIYSPVRELKRVELSRPQNRNKDYLNKKKKNNYKIKIHINQRSADWLKYLKVDKILMYLMKTRICFSRLKIVIVPIKKLKC